MGGTTRYFASRDGEEEEGAAGIGVTVATASAHLGTLRAEMKWWSANAPECSRLIIVVGGAVLPTRPTQLKLQDEFPHLQQPTEYFTVRETQIMVWQSGGSDVVPVCISPTPPPVVGPYNSVLAGDPQARALGARPGDFLHYRRTAADDESPEDYWMECVPGDAHDFNRFATEGSVQHIKGIQAEPAAGAAGAGAGAEAAGW